MLYWAEGGKTKKHSVEFTNMDANMLRIFKRFLLEELGVPIEKLVLTCGYYPQNESWIENREYWLTALDLPATAWRKPWILSKSTKVNGKHPHGVARLSVHDVSVVQKIYGIIHEIAGIEDQGLWL